MKLYLDVVKDESKILGISFGKNVLSIDEFVPRAEAEAVPQLVFAAGNPSKRYIAVSLDNDGPFPSFNILSPILHWIQSDLTVTASTTELTSDQPCMTNWIGPEPPPGSAPHRYVFLLYEQPSGFDRKALGSAEGEPVGLWPRIRWDLAAWEKKAGVSSPVAVGYFQILLESLIEGAKTQ